MKEELEKELTKNISEKEQLTNKIDDTIEVIDYLENPEKLRETSIKQEKCRVLKFKKLNNKAKIPQFMHTDDMAMDISCTSFEYNKSNDVYIYHTGLACESPKDIGIFGMARSGIYKKKVILTNGVGLIDSAIYRGEILFIFKPHETLSDYLSSIQTSKYIEYLSNRNIFNTILSIFTKKDIYEVVNQYMTENISSLIDRYIKTHAPYQIGERIGQLKITSKVGIGVEIATELSDSDRGEGGFGSTGDK